MQIPIQDLLVHAQRVNRTWSSIIQGSSKLQQALFFSPFPGEPVFEVSGQVDAAGFCLGRKEYAVEFDVRVLRNPFHARIARFFHQKLYKFNMSARNWPINGVTPMTRREGSWRRMLVSQPFMLEFDAKGCRLVGYGGGQTFGSWLAADRVIRDVMPDYPHLEYGFEVHDRRKMMSSS